MTILKQHGFFENNTNNAFSPEQAVRAVDNNIQQVAKLASLRANSPVEPGKVDNLSQAIQVLTACKSQMQMILGTAKTQDAKVEPEKARNATFAP